MRLKSTACQVLVVAATASLCAGCHNNLHPVTSPVDGSADSSGDAAETDADPADGSRDQGSDLPPPCEVGSPGPGGFYVSCGPPPLVIMPAGCAGGTDEPVCEGEDQVKLAWGPARWRGVTSPDDGALNTANLGVFATESPNAHPAAEYCLDLVLGGFDNWHLPATFELSLATSIWVSLGLKTSTAYWTSTEANADSATYYRHDFANPGNKLAPASFVRCVRRHDLPLPAPTISLAPENAGFFVLSAGRFDGHLGGATGSNQRCLDDLLQNDWKGKAQAIDRDLLGLDHVRAFLCFNDAVCQSPLPNVRYLFARSGSAGAGGAAFIADGAGRGPGDAQAWSGPNYFDGVSTYWTARAGDDPSSWDIAGVGDYCSVWSADTGSAIYGTSEDAGYGRWNRLTSDCATPQPLICMVDP